MITGASQADVALIMVPADGNFTTAIAKGNHKAFYLAVVVFAVVASTLIIVFPFVSFFFAVTFPLFFVGLVDAAAAALVVLVVAALVAIVVSVAVLVFVVP